MRILAFVACVLLSATVGAQQPAKWRLVEEWRVGGDPDGALSFNDVRGMRSLADGRLVILDYKDQQIHFLDSHGKPERTVGRKGAGPGEYQQANGLIVSPVGEIIVNDPSNNRFSFLSSTGDYLRSVRPQIWGFGFLWDARIDPDGRLNEYVSFHKGSDTTYLIGRRIWARDFASNDTVAYPRCPNAAPPPNLDNVRYAYRTARGGGTMGIPYVAPSGAAVTGGDGFAWSGVPPDYVTIERRVPGACDASAVIHLSGSRVPVSSAARDSAETSVRKFAARYSPDAPDLSKIPRLLPGYNAVYVDVANRLWVERPTATDARRLEVFGPTGAALATLDMPIKVVAYRPVVITNDHLYAFTTDEDGLQFLVSLRIQRN